MILKTLYSDNLGCHYFPISPNKRVIIVPELNGSIADFYLLLDRIIPKEFTNISAIHVFVSQDINENWMRDIMQTIANTMHKYKNHPRFILHIPGFGKAKIMQWIPSYCKDKNIILDGTNWVTFRMSQPDQEKKYKCIGCLYDRYEDSIIIGSVDSYSPRTYSTITHYVGKEEK